MHSSGSRVESCVQDEQHVPGAVQAEVGSAGETGKHDVSAVTGRHDPLLAHQPHSEPAAPVHSPQDVKLAQ